jgi:hypothetical protein
MGTDIRPRPDKNKRLFLFVQRTCDFGGLSLRCRWGTVRTRHHLVLGLVLAAPLAARADGIPIVTLTGVGPNQELPVHRAFYVTGDVPTTVENVQAIVVRRGTPGLFGGADPDCHDVVADLRMDLSAEWTTDEDDDYEDADGAPATVAVRYDAGIHRAYELFPHAESEARGSEVLVSAAWQRTDDRARSYKVLVPHDPGFFAAGYGYCLFVVATERAQQLDDTTLGQLVDGLARKVVACGDKSSCSDDALTDFEIHAERELAASRLVTEGPAGEAKSLASRLKDAARSELGASPGIVEARDHLEDRWHDKAMVNAPASQTVWGETATDPFAQATATLLARSAALLPQVSTRGKGSGVTLFTTDGKLAVRAVQILDDGRSVRVASSRSPSGDQARVLPATTDTLPVTENLTLYDLIQLGRSQVRVDREWISLAALGDRLSAIGLDTWTADDAAYLGAAHAQMKQLATYVDRITAGVKCAPHAFGSAEADQSRDAVDRELGEWLVCAKVDPAAIGALAEQLDELAYEDQAWTAAADKLVARARRLVTITATTPTGPRVRFTSRTWAFSYVTPMIGYAGVVRPDESFGLFYLGVQLHAAPNPVDEVLWRSGVTTKDLRRALALEIGVAPYGGTFGPQRRYSGPAGLPPIFLGLAVHLIPYTSLTVGGTILDRRNSTLADEQPHAILAPYLGFTVQLNLPDLVWQAAQPTTDTAAFR